VPAIVLVFLRYFFLLLLYLFIFYLVRWMVRDLKALAKVGAAGEVPAVPGGPACFKDGAIVVLDGAVPAFKPGDAFELGAGTTLGRSGESEIIIPDDFVSKHHARIIRNKDRYWLEDLGSANGTYINDTLVKQPVALSEGDRIRIGKVIFQFTGWGHEVDPGN
jgi:hypothetical protein